MTKLISKNLIWGILIIVFSVFLFARLVWGFTNPSGNPPSGGGILYYINSKLGIGTSTPPYLVSISSSTDSLLGLFRQGGTIPTIFRQGTDNAFVINSNNSDIVKIKGGNVGIGTSGDPSSKLEVAGQIKITGGSPANGKVLVSDASGLASWQASSTSGLTGSGTTNYHSKWTSASSLGNSIIYDDGTNVGIGGSYFKNLWGVDAGLALHDADGLGLFSWTNDWNGPDITIQKSRGTSVGTHVAVQNNDELAYISFGGSDGTAFQESASIGSSVDGVVATNSVPGLITFFTTSPGKQYGDERMRITSLGNVGIGTPSPQNVLQIDGSETVTDPVSTNGLVRINNTNTTANNISALKFSTNDTAGALKTVALIGSSNTSHTAGAVTGGFFIATNNAGTQSEKMRVTAAGNVGIGTTGPSSRLSVKDTGAGYVNIGQLSGNSTYSGIAFGQSSAQVTTANYSILGNGTHTYLNRPTGGDILFRENNDPTQMIIKATSGNVGIGTAGPNQALTLASGALCLSDNSSGDCGTGNQAGDLMFGNSSGGSGSQFEYFNGKLYIGTLASAWHMIIQDNGNVGIGTESPGYKLDVSGGDINVSGVYRKAGTAGVSRTCSAGNTPSGLTVSGGIITSAGTCTAVGGGSGLTGSGTQNYLAKWSGSSSLANSIITDNGTQVGIGATPGLSTTFAAGGQMNGVVGSGSYAGVTGQGGSYGVYAEGTYCAVEGHGLGTGEGICGKAIPGSAFAGYFEGDVYVQSNLELGGKLEAGGWPRTPSWNSGWYECNAGGGLIILIKGLCTNFGGATPYTTVSGPHNIMFGD